MTTLIFTIAPLSYSNSSLPFCRIAINPKRIGRKTGSSLEFQRFFSIWLIVESCRPVCWAASRWPVGEPLPGLAAFPRLHPGREVGLRCSDQQMVVMVHQAAGITEPMRAPIDLLLSEFRLVLTLF